jgi:hypothetical protein
MDEADTVRFIDGLRKAGFPEGRGVSPSDGSLPLPDKPSIAVLPFSNMSGDPEQDYFSDGITEDIITELSRFSSLFVIARNSSFTYKGRAVDVRRVARELGVRYVLEGSTRRAAGPRHRAASRQRERGARLGGALRPGSRGHLRSAGRDHPHRRRLPGAADRTGGSRAQPKTDGCGAHRL